MAFGFRLRYFAPPGTCLENGAHELTFLLPGCPQPLVLRHVLKDADALPSDPEEFTIDGDGFVGEDAARNFGMRLKTTLSVHSARLGLGFDLGENQATSSLAKAIRQELRAKQGVDVRPIIHGLDVFETSIPITHFRARGRGSVTRVLRGFPESLTADFKERRLDRKHALALALYNASHYEFDPETRFLSLVSVIEVLARRQRRSDAIVALLASCARSLNRAKLTISERKALRNGLGNLKRESISEACARLVQLAGGDVDLFRRCFKARSELLHDGASVTHPDLPRQPHLLDQLVRQVLLSVVEAA